MQMYGNKFKRTKQSSIFLKRNLQLVILSMVYIKKRECIRTICLRSDTPSWCFIEVFTAS